MGGGGDSLGRGGGGGGGGGVWVSGVCILLFYYMSMSIPTLRAASGCGLAQHKCVLGPRGCRHLYYAHKVIN